MTLQRGRFASAGAKTPDFQGRGLKLLVCAAITSIYFAVIF
jgi:hypothetical protein